MFIDEVVIAGVVTVGMRSLFWAGSLVYLALIAKTAAGVANQLK